MIGRAAGLNPPPTSRLLPGCCWLLGWGLILSGGACAGPAWAQHGSPRSSTATTGDPRGAVLDAMAAELRRSQTSLRLDGFEAPYFISYQVGEQRRRTLAARFGSLVVDSDNRSREAFVEVRVGDYQLDSGGEDATDYERYVAYTPDEAMPLEDQPAAIRGVLWLLTEQKYKEAITGYLKKKGKLVYSAKDRDQPSFSREPPVEHRDPPLTFTLDDRSWSDRLRRLSTRMSAKPEVLDSAMRLSAEHQRRWQVNSEGSRVLTERVLFSLLVTAYARAEDGALVEHERMYYAGDASRLPDDSTLVRDVDQLLTELAQLRQAPVLGPYVGPALLETEAAGVLFHEAVGHRLEGHRQKGENEGQTFKGRIGQAILPAFLSVVDDPGLAAWQGQELNGFYRIDEESVAAERVVLVEEGVLRTFLMSRAPIEGQIRSNGHGRAQLGFAPAARMGNLLVSSSVRVPRTQLKQQLLEEARRQGKPYGLIIGDLSGGSTNTSTFGYQAFKGSSRLVWKVDAATGQETLVRGVEIVGTPLTSVSKILAASEETGVFNGFCGAESGSVPVSVVAPAVLIQEMELQRSSRDEDRGPILPPPWRGEPSLLPLPARR